MMVIGLDSGKELFVQDASYFIRVDTTVKQVFLSEDGKRRYTIPESKIEFYDEVSSDEYLTQIHKSIKKTKEGLKMTPGDDGYA